MSDRGVSQILGVMIMLIITIALLGTASTFFVGVLSRSGQNIGVDQMFCDNGRVNFIIRNDGTYNIAILEIDQTLPEGDMAESWDESIGPGSSISYGDTCVGTEQRTCSYSITPSIGRTLRIDVICMSPKYISDSGICETAENNGLCDGLDIVFGDGYRAACCSEHGLCCP
jgi:hypothetical protein